MARKVRPEDLNERELRRLLIEKKREARAKRLEAFRRSGRTLDIAPLPDSHRSTLFEDFVESDANREPTEEEIKQEKKRRRFDRLLFVIEVGAVVGLVLILLNGMNLLQTLNQQVSEALVQSTFTPTPLIQAVVLPSGHTPPTSAGGAAFNAAEIPEHLRPLHQSYASAPPPARSPESPIQIEISDIGVNAPIVLGDGWEQLKQGVGQHIGSSNPGQPGNLVLSAHNDIFGQIFRDLDQLEVGDEIIIYTNVRAYTYVIEEPIQIVEPTFVEVMSPTPDSTVTLISCYPYLVDNKRIVVTAKLME